MNIANDEEDDDGHTWLKCETKHFPDACVALRSFDRRIRGADLDYIETARFSTMHPGKRVKTHTAPKNQRLKLHCGIFNPDGVELQIANLTLIWKAGSCFIIDDSFEHSIDTGSKSARTILEIEHPDLRLSGYELNQDTGVKEFFPHSTLKLSDALKLKGEL